jgi:c-di-AMP phosphodiesterase-like protein
MCNDIETTINFQYWRYFVMLKVAESYNMPLQTLIKRCLSILAYEIKKGNFKNGARKYQESCSFWHTEHIYLSDEEYDVYNDLQKQSKCCFSLLVAIALDEYAEKLFEYSEANSYRINSYTKNSIVQNNYQIYVYCWGKPEKTLQINFPKRE